MDLQHLHLRHVGFSFPCSIRPFRRMLTQSKLNFHDSVKPLTRFQIYALSESSANGNKATVPNSNYVVPLDKSSYIVRPLVEILRDLNKRIPDNIIKTQNRPSTYIPWYQANRMLNFYAPGWCGEIRDVIFSNEGTVTVVYRVTVRGSDGEIHRESTGTVSLGEADIANPVSAAEEIAFCRACSRFGLGLYLYHQD